MAGLILAIVIVAVALIAYFAMRNNNKSAVKTVAKWTMPVGIVLAVVCVFLGCTCSVETGHTGIVTVFGRVEDKQYESGFHFKAPWETVVTMDNRVQKITIDMGCFSSDIQEVKVTYTLNYQIDKNNAKQIYKDIGSEYYTVIVEPSIKEAVKVVAAQYTAEQLVQTREKLAVGIEEMLAENLSKYNIKVSSTAIEDMDFTDAFTDAVEAKQVAEQKKKQAIIEQEQALLQAENEKDIAIKKAEAESEIAKITAEADRKVAEIGADSAEYQGKKEAAIALQKLASINGWTVKEENGINKLYKPDGTAVNEEELKEGAKNLINYYYVQQWDGKLPETYFGSEDFAKLLEALGKASGTTSGNDSGTTTDSGKTGE